MRYAQYLSVFCKVFEVTADRHRDFPSDARVDFIEDESFDGIGFGEDRFKGEHDAGKLSSRRDLSER